MRFAIEDLQQLRKEPKLNSVKYLVGEKRKRADSDGEL
jgi:hypothetical protein